MPAASLFLISCRFIELFVADSMTSQTLQLFFRVSSTGPRNAVLAIAAAMLGGVQPWLVCTGCDLVSCGPKPRVCLVKRNRSAADLTESIFPVTPGYFDNVVSLGIGGE